MERQVRILSLLLSFVAGFCDTVTFIAAGELFSAHVTGNFIIFACNIVKHPGMEGWQRLLTFPVFVCFVMIGGKIGRRSSDILMLIKLEAALLLISGLSAMLIKNPGDELQLSVQAIAMLTVAAMAFQNTFGKLFSKATHGLTTVMTGNVTQASLDLIKLFSAKPFNAEAKVSLKKQLILIIGFFLGCFAGAIMASKFGLRSLILPGGLIYVLVLTNSLVLPQKPNIA